MEHYRGILIGIFIVLALIAPMVLGLRAFFTAFSGDSKKQAPEKPDGTQGDAKAKDSGNLKSE